MPIEHPQRSARRVLGLPHALHGKAFQTRQRRFAQHGFGARQSALTIAAEKAQRFEHKRTRRSAAPFDAHARRDQHELLVGEVEQLLKQRALLAIAIEAMH